MIEFLSGANAPVIPFNDVKGWLYYTCVMIQLITNEACLFILRFYESKIFCPILLLKLFNNCFRVAYVRSSKHATVKFILCIP